MSIASSSGFAHAEILRQAVMDIVVNAAGRERSRSESAGPRWRHGHGARFHADMAFDAFDNHCTMCYEDEVVAA
ncbi:MAG: hypothetical protein LKG16_02610 [Bifidobacterium subtile]|jgi:hypothetical protein|nr:hypothetical protein [Bifidobacterium subtile]